MTRSGRYRLWMLVAFLVSGGLGGCPSDGGGPAPTHDADLGESVVDGAVRGEEVTGDAGNVPDSSDDDTESNENLESSCVEGKTDWTPGTPLFVDSTENWELTGVEGEYLSVLDFDGDGWPDLLARSGGGPEDFSSGGLRHKHLLRNQQDGTFKDVTQDSGLFASRINPSPEYGGEAKVVAAGDVNNDGFVDVFVGRARLDAWTGGTDTSEMMLNNGDGTFRLGPEESDARFFREGLQSCQCSLRGCEWRWVAGFVAGSQRAIGPHGNAGYPAHGRWHGRL